MKLRLFLAAVALMASSVAFAQAQPHPRPQHPAERKAPSVEEKAKAQTEQMKKNLQLTDEQYNKLYKLNLKQQKQQKKIWEKTRKQFGSYNDALEDILTDEQLENYKKSQFRHIGGKRGQAPRDWGKRDGAPRKGGDAPHNWGKPDGNMPPYGEKMEPIHKKPGQEGLGKPDGQYME